MARVTTFPDRHAKGWTGGPLTECTRYPSDDLYAVLEERYTSDAHFAPYTILDAEDKPLGSIPRLNKGKHIDEASGAVDGLGTVRFETLVIDVDGPDHKASVQWVDDQLNLLEDSPLAACCGWYMTRGGYRLLWTLQDPVGPATYLRSLAQLRRKLGALGIEADPLKDYNRLYRLPFVVRDGEPQELPFDFQGLQHPLVMEWDTSTEASPLAGIGSTSARVKFPKIVDKNRNTTLTRFCGSLRHKGLEYDEILVMAQAFNTSRCQPPLDDAEVESVARSIARYEAPKDALVAGGSEAESGDGEGGDFVTFTLGSEVEIAKYVCSQVEDEKEPTVCERGHLWKYAQARGVWEVVGDNHLHRRVAALDGSLIRNGRDRDGNEKFKILKVSKKLMDNVALVCSTLRYQEGWFDKARDGIVFRNTFVHVTEDGLSEAAHSATHRQTVALPFPYTPDAEPEMLLKMLREVWSDKSDVEDRIQLFREWLGTALTNRSTLYQKGMIFVGGGANGKSTLQEIVKALFPITTVTAIAPQDFEQEYRRAQLAHSRINIVAELPEADILGAEAVKAMITGDLMTGREIRRSPFSFTPKAAHLFSANTLPSVRDMTRGFWRRWLLLDFTREFTEDEQDQRLASRIIASEMAAVASWALQGAANLAARGQYDVPQSSHDTLDEWKMVADQVAAFMEDRCALTDHNDRSEYTPLSRVYNHYRTWAESNGHSPLSIRKFGRRLSGLGVMRKRQSSGMTYALSVGPILKAVN